MTLISLVIASNLGETGRWEGGERKCTLESLCVNIRTTNKPKIVVNSLHILTLLLFFHCSNHILSRAVDSLMGFHDLMLRPGRYSYYSYCYHLCKSNRFRSVASCTSYLTGLILQLYLSNFCCIFFSKVIKGNKDASSIVEYQFKKHFVTQIVRIYPDVDIFPVCLRTELYGCDPTPGNKTTVDVFLLLFLHRQTIMAN